MLEKTVVRCTPDALCGGGKLIAQCETTQTMLSESGGVSVGLEGHKQPLWTTLSYLSCICLDCGKQCSIELESVEGQRTGEGRLTFIQP